MNPRTAKNIHRHELIGLNIEVIKSTDKQLVGIQGCVVDETNHMLVVELINANSTAKTTQRRSIPKNNCTFRFQLPNNELVDIDGCVLDSRSENRIKNIIRKRW